MIRKLEAWCVKMCVWCVCQGVFGDAAADDAAADDAAAAADDSTRALNPRYFAKGAMLAKHHRIRWQHAARGP